MFRLVWTLEYWRAVWNALAEIGPVVTLWSVARATLIYWIARLLSARILDAAFARWERRHSGDEGQLARVRTLEGLLKSVVSYAITFFFIVMILDAVAPAGVLQGVLTTAGVLGLAVGFGGQKLVRDVISGFFLIMENQIAVGDYVTIGAASGIVEEVGMRIIRLRDDSGKLWILSNGDISVVTNHSRYPQESFIEIGVAAGTDLNQARDAINAAAAALFAAEPGGLRQPPTVQGVSAFDAAKTTLRVQVVATPRQLAAEQMRVRAAIQEALTQAGVAVA